MSASPTMLTPINSIPLKTSQNMNNTDDDTQDPLVQDVLNEFQRELSSNRPQPPPQQHYQQQPPPQIIQQPPHIIMNNQQLPSLQLPINNKSITQDDSIINVEIAKKAIIIAIISFILFYPGLFSKIAANILPLNIYTMYTQYEFYINIILIFIAIYVLYFYKLL